MKTPLFLIALLTVGALAAAPTAQAAPEAPDLNPCESGAHYGVEIAVGRLCLNYYWPGCNVWIEWTAIPSQDTCLYRTDGLQSSSSGPDVQCMEVYSRTNVGTYSVVRRNSCAPPEFYSCPYEGAPLDQCGGLFELSASTASSAAWEVPWPGGQTPDVQCMDVYSQTYLANGYWLVRRDSCSVQVYQCPEGYSPPAPPCQEASLFTASSAGVEIPWPGGQTPDVECYMVYTRNDVGQYSIVRRTSCSPPEVYHCPYQGAPINQCRGLFELSASAALPTDPLVAASSAQEPMCMYYYHETEVGPVRHVQRDSCHSETYVCDETAREFADVELMNPDHAKLQDCVRDTLDDYIAWG